jgi:hypothetical protein
VGKTGGVRRPLAANRIPRHRARGRRPVKRASIVDRLKTVVTQIRGRDKSKPVLFENIFNQIHAPTQVIALGESEYDDGVVKFRTNGSHSTFSYFEWRVTAPVSAPAPM